MQRTLCRDFCKYLPVLLLITLLHWMWTIRAVELFSQKRFSVVYNPTNLKYANSTESAEQIIVKDLDIILKRFVRISLFPAPMEPEYQKYFHIILKDIARRNCKTEKKNNRPNFEAAIGWNFDIGVNFENITNQMQNVIAEANSICNNTIQLIMLDCRDLADDLSDIESVLIQRLLHLRNYFEATQYKLACLFKEMRCFDSDTLISSLVGHLNSIYFSSEYLGLHRPTAGAKAASTALNNFQNCTQYLRSKHFYIDIGFVTAFSEHPGTWKPLKGCNHFVFWKLMSDWMKQSNNIDVIIYEAYDNSNSVSNRSFGYWEVSENESGIFYYRKGFNYNSRCLDFADLSSLFLKPTTILSQTISSTSIDTSTSQRASTIKTMDDKNEFLVGITTTIVCLLIIICVAVIIVVYRKYTKKVKNTVFGETELQTFVEGDVLSENHPLLVPLSLPYDKVNYEFKPGTFSFDQNSILGEGVHGIVYKGSITKNGYVITAAVKTFKDSSKSRLISNRVLLCEIKVLSYLGNHQNILELLGACTESLENGKILVFTEFCSMGSLDKILKDYMLRLTESRYVSSSSGSSNSSNSNESLSMLSDLERWSYEVANGMEYIASMNVVHGDLATRNVLITEDKQAKIADFGLSRKLYLKDYEKTHEDYLPLRWMAPEALHKLIFNEKTDVWAFGVLLWEIYTFGKYPFSRIKHIDRMTMASDIQNGLKLEVPRYNPKDIYGVMLKCWIFKPDDRPNFEQIKSDLIKKFEILDSSSNNLLD